MVCVPNQVYYITSIKEKGKKNVKKRRKCLNVDKRLWMHITLQFIMTARTPDG